MKKYTQQEFDALPIENGVKLCPTGDYTQVSSFGAWCRFGDGCHFGRACSFEDGHVARNGYPLMSIAGAGSEHRTTYFFNTVDGIIVRSGCFKGTLAEFRAKVLEDCDGDVSKRKAIQYLGFANIVAATWAPELV